MTKQSQNQTNNQEAKELRCEECGRFLAKYYSGIFEIKCVNCKTLNKVQCISQNQAWQGE